MLVGSELTAEIPHKVENDEVTITFSTDEFLNLLHKLGSLPADNAIAYNIYCAMCRIKKELEAR